MNTMLDRAAQAGREAIWPTLAKNYKQRFGHDVASYWNMMAGLTGAYVTSRVDGIDMTPEQKAWCEAFVEGWSECTLFFNKHQAEEQKARRRVHR